MRSLVETSAWAVALLIAWTTTLSTISAPEIVVGAVSAVLCGAAAAAARRLIGQAWKPRARWVGWLPPLALAIPADTVRLLGRALPRLIRDRASRNPRGRAAGGKIRELPPPPAEEPARADFRQAWGLIVMSASPGSVVVDWPPGGGFSGSPRRPEDQAPVAGTDQRRPLVHELGSGPPNLADRVTR